MKVWLIPLSFSSLLGGNMTLIGTPPNILATTILAERGLPSFNFFDFTPIGAIIFATGILYMVFVGRNLLPAGTVAEEQPSEQLREYISEVRVLPDSPLADQTLLESGLGADYDLSVIAILRDDQVLTGVDRETRLQTQDLLIIEGSLENLLMTQENLGLQNEARSKFPLEQLDPDKVYLVEATLAPRASIAGRSLKQIRFRDRYGFTAMAIRRHGDVITQRLGDVRLQFGDALVLQGPRHRLETLQQADDFLVLEPVMLELRRRKKAPLALAALALVLGLVTLFSFHISTAMVIGAVLMVLTGCLTMDEAYQSIEWRSVFLIAGMLPLGLAMETTGTAPFLADQMINLLGDLGPIAVLGGIYVMAGLITEPMSNAAATVLIVPIAIDIALELGANPQTFVLATVIGASTSFLTPVGHQANVLVFGPGGYRFFDYTRVGGLLNIALLITTLIFLPLIWPLF